MKHLFLLLIMSLALVQSASAGKELGVKADARLRQAYDRYGGEQQAHEQLRPIAEHKAGTCRICHGDNGNSHRSVMPSLAGERPEYLLKRWYELVDGHGESTTATRIARRIDEQQMIALALYFSAQQRLPVTFDASLAVDGKPAYRKACKKCHGEDGRGKAGMPVIAGQQPDYMNRTLLQYRDKNGWREHSDMAPQPTKLSPIQIKAATQYAASLGQ